MVFGFELIDARSVADCAQSYNVSVLLRIRPAKSGVCRWCRPNEHISYSLSRCEVADVCDLDLPVCCGGCDDRNLPFGQFYPSNSDLFFVQMQALFSFRFVTCNTVRMCGKLMFGYPCNSLSKRRSSQV